MDPITTEIDNVYVKISWTAPDDNGAYITAYRIQLLASDSLTWYESEYCKYTDPSLLQNMQCYVPMAELTGTKFNLPFNRLIVGKV